MKHNSYKIEKNHEILGGKEQLSCMLFGLRIVIKIIGLCFIWNLHKTSSVGIQLIVIDILLRPAHTEPVTHMSDEK